MTSEFPARLIEGYRDFLAGRMATERERYRELARRGQSPAVMIIGCCDSRVSPEVIFDTHPGELFVVRNIAKSCSGTRGVAESAPSPSMGRHCRSGIQFTSGCRSLRP